jgi:MFS transporter, OPA family, glycerol-3-phosphate transporter
MPAELPALFHDRAFRRRRTANWMVLGLLYAFFYATRYNFSATNAELARMFGWTNTHLGVFETVLPIVYGLSVMFNGPLADRIGGKRAFLIGAAGVTVANFLFGLAIALLVRTPAVIEGSGRTATVATAAALNFGLDADAIVPIMATIWAINGYFQSFGALSIVKVNAQWFHVRERGTFSGIFGVLIRLGLILAFSGVPLILVVLPLPWAYWLPAVTVGLLFVLNWLFMENTPADAGFSGMDTGDEPTDDDGRPARLGFVLRKVFASRAAWTIALCSVMIGFVRRSTIDTWFGKYLSDVYMPAGLVKAAFIPYQTAAWLIALCGIAGGFALGIASDRVFLGRRAPVIFFGFLGMAVMLAALGVSHQLAAGPVTAAVIFGCLSFFVNGAHGMIGGAASMDFGGKKAAATAAGLFDGMQYLVAAPFTGVGLGWVLDRFGWGAWAWAPIPFALIGAALIATLWNVTPRGSAAH